MKKENTNNIHPNTSRRDFLKHVWRGLGFIALLEVVWVFISFLWPSRKTVTSQTPLLKSVGKAENFAKDSVTPFRSGQFYLVRLADGGFLALSLKCTHLACSILWDENANRFLCPCHASQFDVTGNVINPPAPRALDYFPVKIEQGVVKVDTGRAIKREGFDNSQVCYI